MKHTHDRPILVAILLCILGVLWCYWLYALHHRTHAPPPPSTDQARQESELKCHQVHPMIRTTLLVFAIFLSCSALFYLIRMLFMTEASVNMWLHKGIPLLVLLVLFLSQILYITHIRYEKKNVSENCSDNIMYYYYTQMIFGIIQICIGLYLIII
jgi:membrane protein insertase Oxa1/YidC/SpoIIIJ